MCASTTEQCRVRDEGLRVVNLCQGLGISVVTPRDDLTPEEVTANYVPAAAVIRKWQTLLGITGLKGGVGGQKSWF